jgi:hypothetical protein
LGLEEGVDKSVLKHAVGALAARSLPEPHATLVVLDVGLAQELEHALLIRLAAAAAAACRKHA